MGSLQKSLRYVSGPLRLSVFRLSSWRGFWFLWSTRVEFKLRKWVRLPLAGATEVLLANCTQCGSRSSRYDRHNQGEDNNTDPCVVHKFLQAMGPLPTFGDMHLVAGSPPSRLLALHPELLSCAFQSLKWISTNLYNWLKIKQKDLFGRFAGSGTCWSLVSNASFKITFEFQNLKIWFGLVKDSASHWQSNERTWLTWFSSLLLKRILKHLISYGIMMN